MYMCLLAVQCHVQRQMEKHGHLYHLLTIFVIGLVMMMTLKPWQVNFSYCYLSDFLFMQQFWYE